MFERNLDEIMAAISAEETLEAQLEQAEEQGASAAELRRLGRLITEAMKHEVEAEGEVEE